MKVVIEGGPHDGEEHPDIPNGYEFLYAHGFNIPIYGRSKNGRVTYIAMWKERR